MALAVFPHHVVLHAGLFGLVGFGESERGGERNAGNHETGGDTANHGRLHWKLKLGQANHFDE
jgi:hypothetical protein